MTRVRAVSFDAGGTLIGIVEPVGETYARFARRAGFAADAHALDEGFRRAFAAAPPLALAGTRRHAARVRARMVARDRRGISRTHWRGDPAVAGGRLRALLRGDLRALRRTHGVADLPRRRRDGACVR